MSTLRERVDQILPALHAKGITSLREWCRRAGVAESYVNRRMHSPGTRPDILAFEKLAAIAGVEARWLAFGEDTPPAPARSDLRLEREPEHVPADDEVPLETAALRVMDRDRHTLRDLDAVRAAIRAAPRKEIPGADLGELALRLLDAARSLRLAGEVATPSALTWRVAVGRHQRDADVAAEVSAAYNAEAEAEARAAGMDPEQGKANLAAALAKRKGRRGAS